MKDIEERLSYITITDLTYIINKYKYGTKIFDVHFNDISRHIQEFVQSVLRDGYWSEATQKILKAKETNENN